MISEGVNAWNRLVTGKVGFTTTARLVRTHLDVLIVNRTLLSAQPIKNLENYLLLVQE